MNVLQRYGIKEVADVVFYKIGSNGQPGDIALVLDSLKISNIEETAESVGATGGKGNAPLITWDYGKSITLTLQDALFSPASMALMHGAKAPTLTTTTVTRVMRVVATSTTTPAVKYTLNGSEVTVTGATFYNAAGTAITQNFVVGEVYFAKFEQTSGATGGYTLEISADTFPGTYYITGDTYARDEVSGNDTYFQFIIPKAKINSNVTLNMQAEGDPTVFDMSIRVLRPTDKVMMKLVQYELSA